MVPAAASLMAPAVLRRQLQQSRARMVNNPAGN